MSIYTINPYVSVNDFIFGKTRAQITKTCGKPFATNIDNIREIITETREGCQLVYEERKLAYVTLNKHVSPMIGGIEIYADGAIEKLMQLDSDYLIGPQYCIFKNLGICVGGLSKKKIPEGLIVNAFAADKIDFFEFFVTD
jgi:hypothetical protein